VVYEQGATAVEAKRSEDAGVRILVVEDDPQVRNMLGLLLGTRWTVEMAEGGEAALGVARRSPPDLVISDLRMPGIDGITLLRRLRGEPTTQSVPVILVSGRAGEQETIAGLEAGADDFLVKPFSARELLVRVQTRLEVTAMRRRTAQQQAALESLRRHTGWTEQLLDSLPVPLLLLEPGTTRVLFANRAAVRLCGTPLQRGSQLADAGPFRLPEDQGGWTLQAREIAPTTPDDKVEGRRVVWHTPAGALSLLADSELLPALGDHSTVVVLTLRDVTGLVRQQSDLRRTVRMRDEFISVASHELRTPLTTLSLQTEGLLKAAACEATGEGLHRRLATINRQVARLEQLVDILLDVSRLIEGRLELRSEEVDLSALAAESIDLLRDSADRAGSAVHLSSAGTVVGRWDKLRLGQVVTNLLSNAIKFGRGGPVEVEVVATADDRARLEVRDQGVGVPVEERGRIFGRFERASSDRHFPGLGLGLWITKQIVEACGGVISFDSQPGKGSTFRVELPRNL
jgi:signal transduction histidine kinase